MSTISAATNMLVPPPCSLVNWKQLLSLRKRIPSKRIWKVDVCCWHTISISKRWKTITWKHVSSVQCLWDYFPLAWIIQSKTHSQNPMKVAVVHISTFSAVANGLGQYSVSHKYWKIPVVNDNKCFVTIYSWEKRDQEKKKVHIELREKDSIKTRQLEYSFH